MNRSPWRRRRRLYFLPIIFVLFGCWPNCQIGGGMTNGSVTVDGKDGTRTEAEAEAGPTTAKLEFVRETTHPSRGPDVVYLIDKTHVSQTLTLHIDRGEVETMTFLVSEHDEASSFDSHGLEVSPDGRIVAYRLGKEPWRIVHVLSGELAIHSDLEQKKLDWDAIPDPSDEGFVELYRSQTLRLDGTHAFPKQKLLLTWLRETQGQAALAKQLFRLIPEEVHDWDDLVKLLDDTGRAQLGRLVRGEIAAGDPHSEYFAVAMEMGFIELQKVGDELIARGTKALAANDQTLRNAGTDLAEYLRVYAQRSPSEAAMIACDVLSETSSLAPNGRPYATDYGRPLAMVSFAVLAHSNAECDALEDWEADPCTACDGVCRPDALAEEVAKVLATPVAKPPLGSTPDKRDRVEAFIVAASNRTCD